MPLCLSASSYDSSLSLASQNSWSTGGQPSSSSNLLATPGDSTSQQQRDHYNGLDFRIMMESRCGGVGSVGTGPPVTITLVASTLQEKAAWCSDISQVCVCVCVRACVCVCVEVARYSVVTSMKSSLGHPKRPHTRPKQDREKAETKAEVSSAAN